jgi:perosamine synthetase
MNFASILSKLKRKFLLFRSLLSGYFQKPFFGFVQGHSYLSKPELRNIYAATDQDKKTICQFEEYFASFIGSGQCVSFAAGRMAFYALLKIQKIGLGDEVVLTGFTCSVMVNAVVRSGAKPVFCDIDKTSFGTCPKALRSAISPTTKLVVVQHSFGIPCDIISICNDLKHSGVFILEDCALSFGSSIKGKKLGDFGHAALFSTDHSKPINTISGGLIYSKDDKIISELTKIQAVSPELSKSKQLSMFKRAQIEAGFCNSRNLSRLRLHDFFRRLISSSTSNYSLSSDSSPFIVYSDYPYPAKMPEFLARLGILELQRWQNTCALRKNILLDVIKICEEKGVKLPEAYYNSQYEIVPLRFVFSHAKIKKGLTGIFFDQNSFWFKKPIGSTTFTLRGFGYVPGTCRNAENIGRTIQNYPCNILQNEKEDLLKSIETCL